MTLPVPGPARPPDSSGEHLLAVAVLLALVAVCSSQWMTTGA